MGPFGYMHSHLTISLIFFLINFFLKMKLFHVVSTYKTYRGDTLHLGPLFSKSHKIMTFMTKKCF